MTTPKMEVLEVALLSKDEEEYLIKLDPDTNEVKALHTRKDKTERVFKKGKRSSLFAAMELARQVYNKQLDSGWKSVWINFSKAAEDLYEEEIGKKGGKKKKSPPTKVVKAEPPPPPPPPTLKELLKETPAGLAAISMKELKVAHKQYRKLSEKSS